MSADIKDLTNAQITTLDVSAAGGARTILASGVMATNALRDVIAERRRQVEQEGWSAEHDDAHANGTLALAAACYALSAGRMSDLSLPLRDEVGHAINQFWPFTPRWLKLKNPRADLVRAGALIVAEIEALDRFFEREAELVRQMRATDNAEGDQ